MFKTLIVKVVIIGDTTTGKTSIVHRYVKNKFNDTSRPTIGVEFFNKDVFVNDPLVNTNSKKMVPNSGIYQISHHIFFSIFPKTKNTHYIFKNPKI